MDVSEIIDHKSYERWLKETNQPREVCVGLAHRAAMRVLPIGWEWFQSSPKDDVTALPILRCNLIFSGTYWQKVPEKIIRAAARAAADAANAAFAVANAADAAANAAAEAARAAAYAANAARVADAAHAAAFAAGFAARAAAYAPLRQDCRNILDGQDWVNQPLWDEIPDRISTQWADLSQYLRADAARTNEATPTFDANALDWTFFIEWYDRALHGKPQNQKLIEDMVLSSEIDWEAPSQALGVINRMWRESRIAETPNAERLVENPETKKVYSEPDSEIPEDHLQDAVDMLSDAIHAFGSFDGGNAPYAGLSYEFDLLADTLERYDQNPVRLYDRTRQVHNSIHRRANLGDCPEIDKDPKLADFCSQLVQVQEDLKAFDPKVKAKIKGRANSAVEDAPEELEQQVSQAGAALEPIFEGDLGFSFKEDAQLFCDPTTPFATKGDALYRISSRVFRIVHGAYHPAKTATKDAVFWSASISAIAVSPPVQTLYQTLMRLF